MATQRALITVTTMVHGGQGLGTNTNGKKVFVWNALPGEVVRARIIKRKRSYDEAIAEEIVSPSLDRIVPSEPEYLSTSPWQMMTYDAENEFKRLITLESFEHEKVLLPPLETVVAGEQWHYRNKMEYSFWGDDNGLHLALHRRGSHAKQIVQGSKLALPAIDTGAQHLINLLNKFDVRASDLKNVVVRANRSGTVVAALFVKTLEFIELSLPPGLEGLSVIYSDPQSPASITSKVLQTLGDCQLQDAVRGQLLWYDVNSFFQVNLPVFEKVVETIAEHCNELAMIDMYAGVGSIGLSVAKTAVTLVELDGASAAMARLNADLSTLNVEVIASSAETSLDYITNESPIILDPPRAGLNSKVSGRLLEALPPTIVYLSCNPSTQARDVALLQDKYKVSHVSVYNFFPRTPHIESLLILKRI